MAVSENDMDRELLSKIAAEYFARKKKTGRISSEKDCPNDPAGKKDETAKGGGDGEAEREHPIGDQKPNASYRRHWRQIFSPLIVL